MAYVWRIFKKYQGYSAQEDILAIENDYQLFYRSSLIRLKGICRWKSGMI